MPTKIQTLLGHPYPPAPRHAITSHFPDWATLLRFVNRDPELFQSLKSMYPRFILHRDVVELNAKVIEFVGTTGQACFLFPSMNNAIACKAFATSPARGEDALSSDDVSIRVFDLDRRLYGVFFPPIKRGQVHSFWVNTGVGISSRLAEESLKHLESLREVNETLPSPKCVESAAHVQVRQRIAELMERAPVGPPRQAKVAADDVYLFQTGMSTIYGVHSYLLDQFNGLSVLFGFAFHSTSHILEEFGPGAKWFGFGSSKDLDNLEKHLCDQLQLGKPVQAVWAEFPSNPLLVTPDLTRLRALADKYEFVLVIDDTIGSFASVDVLPAADIVVTSLTKSFSGYADVMGGSAVVNPSSKHYNIFKPLFATHHNTTALHHLDAATLLHNSEDYLTRSHTLNTNAAALATHLDSYVFDPKSAVTAVHYPTTSPTRTFANYNAYLRPTTADFEPGYGCLLTITFASLASTIAFYDVLDVHKGPHLGAHVTIALPYTMGIYGKDQLEWAKGYGLDARDIRISVGLEETSDLVERFEAAKQKADAVWREEKRQAELNGHGKEMNGEANGV